jgi:mono/diheme cytochrome c family protein
MSTRYVRLIAGVTLLAVAAAALTLWWNAPVDSQLAIESGSVIATPELMARGAYLAQAGNCASCHTARGGAAYAGGSGIATPFGVVYSSNLTPDPGTGLGLWSAEDFWRALHLGRSRDGHMLYPAFPYTSYTMVTREDSDALFAYLRGLKAVERPNTPHTIAFPYSSQAALAIWRALYFREGVFVPESGKTPEWNRGAYLVRGLGHCGECHSARNAFGATQDPLNLQGGLIPIQRAYAPSLSSPMEAGVTAQDVEKSVQLLKTGVALDRSATGPMAEVVYRSTQHLTDYDVRAMVHYLKELPRQQTTMHSAASVPASDILVGEKIYALRCAGCHGEHGEGAVDAYAPLSGNRAVNLFSAANLIQVVLRGGYPPATQGNPRPFGMPPFRQTLSDAEVAAVLTYIRQAWGNSAPAVSVLDVIQHQ